MQTENDAAPKVASDTGAGLREAAQALVDRFPSEWPDYSPCYDEVTALREALATATDATDGATGGGEVIIKPLHWHEPSPSVSYPNWTARNFHTQFEARIDTSKALKWGKFPLSFNGNMVDVKFDTIEQAKAYAQAEYETRMRQLLSDVLTTTPGGDLLEQAAIPFAEALEEWGEESKISDDRDLWEHPLALLITVGDVRRLARALSALKPAGDGGEA